MQAISCAKYDEHACVHRSLRRACAMQHALGIIPTCRPESLHLSCYPPESTITQTGGAPAAIPCGQVATWLSSDRGEVMHMQPLVGVM